MPKDAVNIITLCPVSRGKQILTKDMKITSLVWSLPSKVAVQIKNFVSDCDRIVVNNTMSSLAPYRERH